MAKPTRFACPQGHGLTMRTDGGKRSNNNKRMYRTYACIVCGIKLDTIEVSQDEYERVAAFAAIGKKHLAAQATAEAQRPVPLALPAPVTRTPTCAERRNAAMEAFGSDFDEEKFKQWIISLGEEYTPPDDDDVNPYGEPDFD